LSGIENREAQAHKTPTKKHFYNCCARSGGIGAGVKKIAILLRHKRKIILSFQQWKE
jgi:hypothetical protein